MRLLVVSQYFWPENFRINELVAALSARGHEVTVLTGLPNYPSGVIDPEFAKEPARFARYHGARVIRVPLLARGRGNLRLLLNYISFAISGAILGPIRLRGERFDAIFVAQYSPVTVGIPAVVLGGVKGVPIAFWILDKWPESLEAVGVVTSRTLLGLVGRLVSFIYSRCDLILSPSRSMIAQLHQELGSQKRVEYLPNWTESQYRVTDVAPAREVPTRDGAFSVMFAGNIGAAQDFPAILDAAELLRDCKAIRWLIVGDGRMAGWVKDEVERRSLHDAVVLLGAYPGERMPSFFKHADALLVSLKTSPVFAMTAPGKIQSYLAFGLPVVGMLEGEGADVIVEAGAGLTCAPGDAAGLAKIVLRLAGMSAEARARMGAMGSAYASREFELPTLVERLEAQLAQLWPAPTAAG